MSIILFSIFQQKLQKIEAKKIEKEIFYNENNLLLIFQISIIQSNTFNESFISPLPFGSDFLYHYLDHSNPK